MKFKFLTNRIYSEEDYQKWKSTGMLDDSYDEYFLSYVFEITAQTLLFQEYNERFTGCFAIIRRLFGNKKNYYTDEFIRLKVNEVIMAVNNTMNRDYSISYSPIDQEAEDAYNISLTLNWEEKYYGN